MKSRGSERHKTEIDTPSFYDVLERAFISHNLNEVV